MQRRNRLIFRWAAGGMLFGTLFPLVGWGVEGHGYSLEGIGIAHADQPVLWIVDLAPLVLGIAGGLIGVFYARLDGALRATDRQVRERTAELQSANDQLQELMRSKDQFVATVSHEVRTPLTVIMGFADELTDNLARYSTEESVELASLIGDQSREVNNIIDDLLVAARSDLGSLRMVPEKADLAAEVATVVRSCVCAKEVRDSIELDLEPAASWVDACRTRQIIRNLLTNAVRYGGEAISVVVRRNGSTALVQVRDDGDGIPPDQVAGVFEAYRQGDNASPVSGSVGLGLHVSRTLARLMGGELTYRYEGGLSVFELALPAMESDGARPPVEPESGDSGAAPATAHPVVATG